MPNSQTDKPATDPTNTIPIVGVMGSGTQPHADRATALGTWLATLPVHLLTGGGSGVMESVSRAFHSVQGRTGKVLGILPGQVVDGSYSPVPGYPNPWIELSIRTHLPLSGTRGTEIASRNHINILTADIIIALPGGHGTASEVSLAKQYGKPLVAYVSDRGDIPGIPDDARIEPEFDKVKEYVLSHLAML